MMPPAVSAERAALRDWTGNRVVLDSSRPAHRERGRNRNSRPIEPARQDTIVLKLNPVQRRVLGVLIEKSCTTPEQYPLTVNALVAGGNQKSNRDPVMELSEHDVMNAVQELVRMKLVRQAGTATGARAIRYEHTVPATCGWSPREVAILTELLLRGPQTVGELRTRADRMSRMADLPFVQGVLDELAARQPPLVRSLPREPGRSAIRFSHTFYPDGESPPSAVATWTGPVTVSPGLPAHNQNDGALLERVDQLEARVAALEAAMNRFTS
ncbi:MAG: YceH family protein [Phycisphaerales bacterium]|nr:YceH family protein [Phycisphaerales bacterium]